MSRDITVGRTTIYWDKGRQGWVLPGQHITKDRDMAKRAAWVIDKMTRGVK